MRLLLQLDRPNGGQATFKGQSYRSFRHPATEVGALLDAAYAHPSQRLQPPLGGRGGEQAAARVDEALAMVGLTEVAKRLSVASRSHASAAGSGDGPAR